MSVPVSIADFQAFAVKALPVAAKDYYESGAQDEITLKRNCSTFDSIVIRPRFLRNVAHISTALHVFGVPLSMPICVAPTAMQRMASPEGEVATARAAESLETLFTLSTYSTSTLEEVQEGSSAGPKWLQLYVYTDRAVSASLVRRAVKAGYKAIVITIDTPYLGRRLKDLKNKFRLPPPLRLANFDEVEIQAQSQRFPRSSPAPAAGLPALTSAPESRANVDNGIDGLEMEVGKKLTFTELLGTTSDLALCWENDIEWIRSLTSLPVLVKGVLTHEDASLAMEYGLDGIVVSNHGGRQLDTVPSTIAALPEVARAVKEDSRRLGIPEIPVFLDGGIRRGTDVFKALAFGATAVFVGRPCLWGLAHSGQEGVEKVLRILQDEFRLAMALAGTRSLSEITRNCVKWEHEYKRTALL